MLTFHNVIIFIKAVFDKNKNEYCYFFKKDCVKNLIHNIVYYKYYISIELTFLEELLLIRKANQESDVCHYWHFLVFFK